MNSRRVLALLAGLVLCCFFAATMSAQVKTQTSARTTGKTVTTTVESGTVVYVSGNDFIVQMPDGAFRNFTNVPESARATVDGKQIGIHDLKVGMKLQRTITTTNSSQFVTTVQSVTGTVWSVNPPSSVILTLENGENRSFKIPKDQKFNVDGEMKDAWGLKKGMKVTATKIVVVPQTVIDSQRKVTGTMPPPPPAPPADAPILIAEEIPAPAPAAAAPATLPKTGSELPLIGFLGMLFLASGLGLSTIRSKFGK